MEMSSTKCRVAIERWIFWTDLKEKIIAVGIMRFAFFFFFFPDVMQHTTVHKKHNGKSPVAK